MENQNQRKIGVVVHVVKERGFFFIYHEGGRIFCHASKYSELELPAVNTLVSFEIGPARKAYFKIEAINARPEHPGKVALAAEAGA